MLSDRLKEIIVDFPNFPKEGIIFKDILPILRDTEIFSELIYKMSNWDPISKCDALVAIDARGFIFGTGIALAAKKPLILARKPGKLPGDLLENSYKLEYGINTLSIQRNALKNFQKFVIVDDLFSTGGTVGSVVNILTDEGKTIIGASAVVEFKEIFNKSLFNFPIYSQLQF